MTEKINKNNTPIWGAIKSIPVGKSEIFPIERKNYVQQTCWRLKEIKVGKYTTTTTKDKEYVVVTRVE